MQPTLSVEDLLKDAPSYDGQLVSVDGQFIAMHAASLICGDGEALEVTPQRPKIKLECPDLVDRCLLVVSPYVGGPWYYHDPAMVSGRFLANPEPRITDLTILSIRRSGTEHRVDLAAPRGDSDT